MFIVNIRMDGCTSSGRTGGEGYYKTLIRNSQVVVSFNRISIKAARGWYNSLRSNLFEGVGRHRTETTLSLKKAKIDLARSGNI